MHAHRQPLVHAMCVAQVTFTSTDLAVIRPPYDTSGCERLSTGTLLGPDELKAAVTGHQASAVVLGGSGLLRTDGSIQLGVRKLISGVQGLAYDTDWLPRVVDPSAAVLPILLW